MDETTEALREKLDQLVRETAAVSIALDRATGVIEGVPHYSRVEGRAHELGQQLSREIQRQQMARVAAQSESTAVCPACGMRCRSTRKKRKVLSIDGILELEEPIAQCPTCRRAFFPLPGEDGL
jgi:uncharacterized protein with PIN domain